MDHETPAGAGLADETYVTLGSLRLHNLALVSEYDGQRATLQTMGNMTWVIKADVYLKSGHLPNVVYGEIVRVLVLETDSLNSRPYFRYDTITHVLLISASPIAKDDG